MADLIKESTLTFKNDEGEVIELYPKTTSDQVLLSNGQTVHDHLNDDIHLYQSERNALNKTNTPTGYIRLNDEGHIPDEFIDPAYTSIRTEFNTISDMLAAGNRIPPGTTIMVLDASEDPTVTHDWAVYRRKKNSDAYYDLSGYDKLYESEGIDMDMSFENLPNGTSSNASDIDKAVDDSHTHVDKAALDNLTEIDNHLVFKGKRIAFDDEVPRFISKEYSDESFRPHDFWFKPSFNQSWWGDPFIEYAGTTCYEKYRDVDTMSVAPKLRTSDATSVCRMFYRCYELEVAQQYDVRKCIDFTGQYTECTNLKVVPCMNSFSGKLFSNQFKMCSFLEHSPEMILDHATNVSAQYSGCSNLERVLPFGSTKNVTDMKEWFNGCSALRIIYSPIDFSSITSDGKVYAMFNDCLDLEEVEFVEGTLTVSISLVDTNLSAECISGILRGLPEISTGKSINLSGIPSFDLVPTEDIEFAEARGWSIIH